MLMSRCRRMGWGRGMLGSMIMRMSMGRDMSMGMGTIISSSSASRVQ